MSIRAMTAVWQGSKQSASSLLMLLAIADFADDNGLAFPSVRRLAQKARVTERQAWSLIRKLKADGELRIEVGGGRGRTNRYRVGLKPEVENTETKNTEKLSVNTSALNYEIQRIETLKPASADPSLIRQDPSIGAHSQKRSGQKVKPEYSPEFELAFSKYPERAEGNSKPDAYKAWCTRIKQGISPDALIAGVERYSAYIRATGATLIKQASTFFGPGEHWKQPWGVVPNHNGNGGNGARSMRPEPRTLAEARKDD